MTTGVLVILLLITTLPNLFTLLIKITNIYSNKINNKLTSKPTSKIASKTINNKINNYTPQSI